MWMLRCSECSTAFEIRTGAGFRPACGCTFGFDQFVCSDCRRLQSVASRCEHNVDDNRCERCTARLEPWAGRVYFRADNQAGLRSTTEVVDGPCPGCGASLTATEVGLWD
jgi:hypothetical protein